MNSQQSVKQIIRYMCNFMISLGVDLFLYMIILHLLKGHIPLGISIIIAVCSSRVLSSLVNFTLNKQLFSRQNTQRIKEAFIRYYILWVGMMILSATLTYLLNAVFGINEVVAKVMTDLSLGIFSYYTQREWVFKR